MGDVDDEQAAPRVLLVGMMGAGKTTVGRAIAERTGWPYLDNDEVVARVAGMPTADLLATAGEAALRRAESSALDVVLTAAPPLVAGVAAGAVLDPAARARLRADGFVVYLRVPLAVLAERVAADPPRPWLGDDVAAALARLHDGREALYREVADLVVDAADTDPDAVAARIVTAARA